MEIAPVPHRATRREWRRLSLGLLILLPVVLLVALPPVLGLDRYVVTDAGMDGALGRGSVVLAREVPPTDLAVGDVLTMRPPGGGADERVVRRVVAIEDGVATTRGDTAAGAQEWAVPLDGSAYSRVWLGVPWIGYPFVVDGGWVLLVLIAVAALTLALGTGRGRGSAPQPERPVRTEVPVG